MNYYKHHIGDYDSDTSHLTMLEDGAYRRLMSLYYRRESPVPADIAQACRLVRATTKQDREAVEAVLKEFFVLDAEGWRHKRCDAEIAAAQEKAKANRENGKAGGRPKRKPNAATEHNQDETEEKPTGLSVGSDVRAGPTATSHKPLANNHSEAKASGAVAPPTDRDLVFANGVPLLTAAGVKESNARSFLAAQSKAHGDAAVRAALERCAAERPIQPVSWLQTTLGQVKPTGKHAGFASKDYRAGVTEDGFIA